MLDVGGEGVTKNKGGLEIMAVLLYIYVHFIFWDMEVLFVGFCVFFGLFVSTKPVWKSYYSFTKGGRHLQFRRG